MPGVWADRAVFQRPTLATVEDTGMLKHSTHGHIPHVDDVFEDQDHVGELPSPDESSEGGISNAVLATRWSSASTAHVISDRVIAVSLEISLPAVPGLSGHLTDITSTAQPVVSSTLEQSGRFLLDLSNSTAVGANLTAAWSAEEIGAVVIISLMVPFILLSNVIVILCVIRCRRLQTPTNYFITSLAAVDIFVALATPFVVVVEVFKFSDVAVAGDVMLCLLPNRILMMGCGVSVLTLAAIAYDRHTALVSPLRYVNIMTTRRVTILVLLSWLYSVIIVWFPLMAGWYHVPSDMAPCSANLIQGKAPLLFLGAIFVPSCVAIMICYFRILMVARQHVKAIAAFEFAVHRRVRVKCMMHETKCAKTLALIIGVFLALWLPYLILIFTKTVSSIKFDIWLQTYLILLAVFNSGINPWMYAFMNSELRAAFRRLFRDMCGDRLCAPADRRSSLVSVVSTPRLSLTDSRALSIIPEASLEVNTDPLARRLELCVEREPVPALYRQRHHSHQQLGEISAQSFLAGSKSPARPAASCSNLDTVDNTNTHRKSSLTRPRSISFKHDLTREPARQTVQDHDLNRPGLYHQMSVPLARCQETLYDLNTTACPCDNLIALPTSSVTSSPYINLCVPLIPQQPPPQLSPLLPPSCPPGCAQSEHYTSSPLPVPRTSAPARREHYTPSPLPVPRTSAPARREHYTSSPLPVPRTSAPAQTEHYTPSPLPVPRTSAPAQTDDQTSSSPPACCHLHCTESNQLASPDARPSPTPHPRPQAWPTTPQDVARPDTCPAAAKPDKSHSRHMYSNYTHAPSSVCGQLSAECRHCSLPQLGPAQTPGNSQFCAMFSHVPAYTFLLPLCETLALDVISTAARLENCIDLARLVGGEHRILIQ